MKGLGSAVDGGLQIPIEIWASTMMHELGHNFGLVHGSLADPGNASQECHINKPNYISVMNYTYGLGSIVPVIAPGTTTPISCASDADCGPPSVTSGRCAPQTTVSAPMTKEPEITFAIDLTTRKIIC